MPGGNWPLVHIVIVNYKGWQDTLECLGTLRTLNYPRYEIVIVDNASPDESVQRIRAAYPDVTLLEAGANLGFAGGNNVGIRYALDHDADFIWLLNNDTYVVPDSLIELLKCFTSPATGITASKMYYASEPNKLWFAGAGIHWPWGIAYHIGQDEDDHGQYDQVRELEAANGASMLVSRAVFERAGLFDERYFLYFEETDLCFRARKAGFTILFAPRSRIWHKVSSSVGASSPVYLYYHTRNHIRFVRANRTVYQYVSNLPRMLRQSRQHVDHHDGGLAVTLSRYWLWLEAVVDGILGRGGRKERLTPR